MLKTLSKYLGTVRIRISLRVKEVCKILENGIYHITSLPHNS